MNIFNKNKREQKVLIFTDTGSIVTEMMPVTKACVLNHDTQEAWPLDPQAMVEERGTGRAVLIACERDIAGPLPWCKDEKSVKNNKELVNSLAHQARKNAEFNHEKKQSKDRVGSIMQILILGGALVTAIIVVAALLLNGTLSM